MKRFLFLQVLKKTHALPFLAAFFVFYIFGSLGLWLFDGEITSIADGFWLGFNIVTSIGLGDYTVTGILPRLIAVLMGLYGAMIVAFIPSLVASYYLEKMKSVQQQTLDHYKEELQELSSLSPERRRALALQIQQENQISRKKAEPGNSSSILKSWELFLLIFRQTHMWTYAAGFLVFFVVCCFLIYIFDPSIQTIPNAFWFGFMIITTIGFGDFTVVHWSSRLVTMLLGIYGIFIVDFICGVIASYFFDSIHAGGNESISQMLYKLEHLSDLSPQELKWLENQVHRVLQSTQSE